MKKSLTILFFLSTLSFVKAQNCCSKFGIYRLSKPRAIFCYLSWNNSIEAIRVYNTEFYAKKNEVKFPLITNVLKAYEAIVNEEPNIDYINEAKKILETYIDPSKSINKNHLKEYAFLVKEPQRLNCAKRIISTVKRNPYAVKNYEKILKENENLEKKLNRANEVRKKNAELEEELKLAKEAIDTSLLARQLTIESELKNKENQIKDLMTLLNECTSKNKNKRWVQTNPIYFEKNEYMLNRKNKEILDELIPLLRNCKDCSIRLEGFTDDSGSEEYNRELSEKRVISVENYLTKNGVPGIYIWKEYYGELGEDEDNKRKVDILIFRPQNNFSRT